MMIIIITIKKNDNDDGDDKDKVDNDDKCYPRILETGITETFGIFSKFFKCTSIRARE